MPLDDPEKTKADQAVFILYVVLALFVSLPFFLFFMFGQK
jgi:hypothetical protein